MKATVKEAFDEERLAVRGALDELESAGALEGRFETDWLMAAERADRELKAAGIDLDSIQRDILARARMGGRYLDSEAQGVMDKMLAELERLNGENAWKVSKRTNIPAGTRDVRTGRLRATKQSAHKEIADRLRTAGELQRNAALKSRILGRPGRTTGSADSLERLLGSAHHNIHDRKLESIRWARKESRAWASEGSNMINFGEGSTSSVVHEFGHHIEYRNANVKRRMLQWRESRAIGESKTAIYQGTTEIGYRDGFVDHYVGKTYVSGWTETVSMGLEGFADVSSLRKLIMQDPEHLKLIWAMLRGY